MIPAAITCAVVFVVANVVVIRLMQLAKACDDAQEAAWANHPSNGAVAEAERIVRAAYTSDPTTWP